MEDRILMAEIKVEMKKTLNIDILEINLQLSCPLETRGSLQTSKSMPSYPDYPMLMPERKGYAKQNHDIGAYDNDLQERANVRVNSVIVNVKTRPA